MKAIRNYICSKCGHEYDPLIGDCPKCSARGPFSDISEKYIKQSRIGAVRNFILFMIGWLGFQILGSIISLIASTSFTPEPGMTPDEALIAYEKYLESPAFLMTIQTFTYILTVAALMVVVIKVLPETFKSFKTKKNIFIGITGGFVLVGLSILCGFVISLTGIEMDINENQSLVEDIAKSFPFLSILILAFVGPFSEELTYRVGLFSLSSRFGKIVGYIVTIIVFSLIHFDFASFNKGTYINELLNLPSYMIAGFVLSYLYDKYGLASSLTAHIINNLISVFVIFLGQ